MKVICILFIFWCTFLDSYIFPLLKKKGDLGTISRPQTCVDYALYIMAKDPGKCNKNWMIIMKTLLSAGATFRLLIILFWMLLIMIVIVSVAQLFFHGVCGSFFFLLFGGVIWCCCWAIRFYQHVFFFLDSSITHLIMIRGLSSMTFRSGRQPFVRITCQ